VRRALYRTAYRKFFEEARASGDAVKAEEAHLLTLDQNDMLATVQEFAAKLRPAKPR
jgi:hypothetical protein